MSTDIEAIAASGGERITGPGALSGGWRRMLHLAWTLAYLEFRLKFFGSALGYIWQLARPLLLFGVYYIVFTQFVQLSAGVKYHPQLLLMGIMLYQFWVEVTAGSVRAVLDRENLVRKIHFPRIVIPVAVTMTGLLNLAVNLIAVVVFMIIAGVPWTVRFLEFIPLLGFLVVFAFGLAMLLSALFVRYRDIQPIWEVVTMAAFYATPIIYTLEVVKIDWARQLIMFNPLAVVIQQTRHALFDPSVPSAKDAIGGVTHLLVPIAIVLGTAVVGFWYFNRAAPHVAEEL
ncbi:ABC transporter permease [Candidatus Solirubrobacter pratensis]|uniref:ABC transporter permease n=1 Tax=Candidatus Solirubrobacter pratensis TaxID=1298857 RepID=UPI000410D1B3|nr:ABC transporter permease [Candidatus Solirubrobacter pratensis]